MLLWVALQWRYQLPIRLFYVRLLYKIKELTQPPT